MHVELRYERSAAWAHCMNTHNDEFQWARNISSPCLANTKATVKNTSCTSSHQTIWYRIRDNKLYVQTAKNKYMIQCHGEECAMIHIHALVLNYTYKQLRINIWYSVMERNVLWSTSMRSYCTTIIPWTGWRATPALKRHFRILGRIIVTEDTTYFRKTL